MAMLHFGGVTFAEGRNVSRRGWVMTWNLCLIDFSWSILRDRCVKVPSRFSFCKLRKYCDGEIWPESCWQKGFYSRKKTGLQYEDSTKPYSFCLASVYYTHTWILPDSTNPTGNLLPFSNACEPSLVWFSLPSASVKAEAPEAAGAWTKGVGRSLKLSGKFAPETNGWLEDGSPFLLGWKAYCSGTVAVSFTDGIFFVGLRNFNECMAILVYAIFWEWTFLENTRFLIVFGMSIPRKFAGWSGQFNFKLAVAQLLKRHPGWKWVLKA